MLSCLDHGRHGFPVASSELQESTSRRNLEPLVTDPIRSEKKAGGIGAYLSILMFAVSGQT